MPLTQNGVTLASPKLEVEISADDIAALGAPFSTPETVDFSDQVVRIEPVTDPQRDYVTQATVGGVLMSTADRDNDVPVWRIVVIDDEISGGSGEYGTDSLTVVGTFRAFKDAIRYISALSISPDGDDPGKQKIDLASPIEVLKVGQPSMDASMVAKHETEIIVATSSESRSKHS